MYIVQYTISSWLYMCVQNLKYDFSARGVKDRTVVIPPRIVVTIIVSPYHLYTRVYNRYCFKRIYKHTAVKYAT